MTIGRRVTVGFTLLCAFLFCAFSASSAMAVSGTTAFTCVKGEGAGFKDAHCKEAVASGAAFKHLEIAQDLTTNVHATNEKTSSDTLKAEPLITRTTLLGVEIESQCLKAFGHGKLANKLDAASKEHYVQGEKITLHTTECTVMKPAGCAIPNKTILFQGVSATTKGQGNNIQFKPEVGKTLVTVTYEKCTNPFLNGPHTVEGSFKAQISGSTGIVTHKSVTEEKTLTVNGASLGIEGKLTLSQAAATAELGKAPGATGNPISSTQVNT
jgi:hypothetical protein